MSVSLRFHILQRKDNRIIKETLEDMFKNEEEKMKAQNSSYRKKSRQLSIHEIDALSKRLTFRKGTRSRHGSLMDELFDDYDLGEFNLEEPTRVPELVSNGDSTSDSDTDAASMASSSASSIIRDDFVLFAKSLRRRQYADGFSSDYSLTSHSSIIAYD